MKTLTNLINEAREVEYRVSFLNFIDDDTTTTPTVKILVPRELARKFDDFLEKEQDNIFAHAEGSSVEY